MTTARSSRMMDALFPNGDKTAPQAPVSPYPVHEVAALGERYTQHLQDIAEQGLNTPEQVAVQLAWRDAEIEKLRADVALLQQANGFRVSVQTMVESCGTSYYVCIDRPDRSENAMPWDPGRITPTYRPKLEEAEFEAEEWRVFLDPTFPIAQL